MVYDQQFLVEPKNHSRETCMYYCCYLNTVKNLKMSAGGAVAQMLTMLVPVKEGGVCIFEHKLPHFI